MKAGGGIIYQVINLINNKCYIGQTVKTLNERKKQHLRKLNSERYYFHNALKKYGKENFEWKIICECSSREELNEMEKYYIKELNTKRPNGYNLTEGGYGSSGYTFTDEAKKKISDGLKGKCSGEKHWNYGNHWSDEIKKKNSETQKGRKLSDEIKKKISNSLKGKYSGKHHTNETKQKMSILKQGLYNGKNNPNAKQYKIYNILTGETKIIKCIKQWCNENNFKYDTIKYYIKNDKPYNNYIIEKLNCKGELPK